MGTRNLILAVVGVIAIGFGAGLWYSKTRRDERVAISLQGIQVRTVSGPEFISGPTFNIEPLHEPILIVNFWASWCPQCAEELPSLLKLVRANPGKIRVVAFSQDEDEKKMSEFLSKFGDLPRGFDVARDADGSIAKRFRVPKLPESFILDRERRLVRKIEGYDDWSAPGARAYFNLLIAE